MLFWQWTSLREEDGMAILLEAAERRREPEIMDQPGLDLREHERALAGLRRINRLSGSAAILWPPILDLARASSNELRILDIATGGGDVPIDLWKRAQRSGLAVRIDACDVSLQALDHARERARREHATVRLFQLDALCDDLPADYDVLTCSLFLHHLEEDEAVGLLRRMTAAARRMVLINDLVRSPAGLAAAYVVSRLITRSRVVHVDAPLSVKAAFTIAEVRDLARRAGLEPVKIERRWPFRFLLTWRKP